MLANNLLLRAMTVVDARMRACERQRRRLCALRQRAAECASLSVCSLRVRMVVLVLCCVSSPDCLDVLEQRVDL
jgi:hypothetical protein